MEKRKWRPIGLFMNNKVVVPCSSVSMPALIRNEEPGTQTAHTKSELIGFDAGMRNEPTGEPSVDTSSASWFGWLAEFSPSTKSPTAL
jgi:hypothetical protein